MRRRYLYRLGAMFEYSHDPSFAEPFRAYSCYFEDLAGVVGGQVGWGDTLFESVHAAVLGHPGLHSVQRRAPGTADVADIRTALRKSWGMLRRIAREVEDERFFDAEANPYLPYLAYYAVYHAALGVAVASRQRRPRDHAAALNVLGQMVRSGWLPFPWGVWCEGCPQTESARFGGLAPVGAVHVLSRPTPDTSEERLAMFLRTTRAKELERRFSEQRAKKVTPGLTRRNIFRQEKENWAKRLPVTTLFDVFYRVRKKASYEEADVFVLGAKSEQEARGFAEALVIVTDGTVAALEALICAFVGPGVLAEAAEDYAGRTGSTLVGRRSRAWRARQAAQTPRTRAEVFDDIPF